MPNPPEEKNPKSSYKLLLRNFIIELVIYGGLVTAYYFLALRLLSTPLKILFDRYLVAYAIAALVLIIAQGVLLESLTSFLLDRLGLQRFE